jgi:2-polyprenyl-3-methyl-5-hydroxy-6-metoxy-1,4-benzoquinol methylase
MADTYEVTSWDESAEPYLRMVRDRSQGFNHLASDTAEELIGDVEGRAVLDVGCGEGSFARRLADLGARVTAVEPTADLLAAAVEAERQTPLGISYRNHRAEQLGTVETGSMDIVVALLVLHHVSDLDAALASMHRVLRPSGSLVLVLPHPFTDHPEAAWAASEDGPRRLIGSYVEQRYWQADAPGAVRAIGWHHRPLATWINALADAGFVIERVLEPVGSEPRRADGGGPWQHVPRFLAIRARGAK